MNIFECKKTKEECPYRFDYRGCNKINCPHPNEYRKKERLNHFDKWGIILLGYDYDFSFKIENKYYYATERCVGRSVTPDFYDIYEITESEYNMKKHINDNCLLKDNFIICSYSNFMKDEFFIEVKEKATTLQC